MNDHMPPRNLEPGGTGDLRESLHRRADRVDVTTVPSLDRVRGRAGQIRRRRRALTAGVAVAALAIVAPAAWSISSRGDSAPLPPVDTPTSITPPASGMDLRGLPRSNDVGMAWIDMSSSPFVLHRTDGSRVKVSVSGGERVFGFATLLDGRTVAKTESRVVVWDRDGTEVFAEKSPGTGIAVDATHRTIAWADDDGAARVLVTEVPDPLTLTASTENPAEAVAIDTSRADCTRVEGDGPRCYVTYNEIGGDPMVYDSAGHGAPLFGSEIAASPFSSVSDVHDDGTVLTVAGRDATDGCGSLQTSNSGVSPTTCDRVYGTFSSDGQRISLIGDDPDRSPADGGADMTDRIGVATMQQPGHTWFRAPSDQQDTLVGGIEWANTTDLVAKVWQDDAWSLVRFDGTGTATQVAEPVPGDLFSPAYALETQP